MWDVGCGIWDPVIPAKCYCEKESIENVTAGGYLNFMSTNCKSVFDLIFERCESGDGRQRRMMENHS